MTRKQHNLVRLWSIPDELIWENGILTHKHNKLISMFNSTTSYPIDNITIEERFQMSSLWTWIILLPLYIIGVIINVKVTFKYKTLIITTDSGERKTIKFLKP